MAEMRASPVVNPRFKRIAEVLRDLQGPMGEIIPFTDANPFRALMPAASTFENLAYGNSPFSEYGGVTNRRLPIVKTGREGELTDIADVALMASGLPMASRGVARGANYLGDVLTQAVTRNPQATSMRALDEIARMSPVPQMFDPALAKRVMPETKAVDEAGNPLLMYHGTNKEITDFLQTGKPTYLSTDPEFSSYYATAKGGNIIPAYVNAKKTWDYQNPKDLKAFQKYLGLTERDLESPQGFDEGEQYLAAARGQWDFIEGKEFQKFLKNKGYDSFYVVENGSRNIGVFDPQQVKSALSDPDIMEQFLASSKPPKPEPTYGMEHRPMGEAGGASRLHEAYKSFGEDVYGKNALQYFGSGDPREAGVVRLMRSMRDNPDREVTIYRGVPEGVEGKINPGDWITLDKNVAEDYGKVVSMKVKAKDITTWPDSLLEFGYFPE